MGFTDCTERTVFLFSTDDSHFTVKADGTLTVSRVDRPDSKAGVSLKKEEITVRFVRT